MARLLEKTRPKGPVYIFDCEYGEHVAAKEAGFWWDKSGNKTGIPKAWYTYEISNAAKLRTEVDPEDGDLRRRLNLQAKKEAEALELSRAADSNRTFPVPDGLSYLPYQNAGIAYALRKKADGARGVIIGDEMGLGKTIQAIGYINDQEDVRHVLVIAPASLKINWKRELERWLVRDFVIEIVSGSEPPEINGRRTVTIINYDILTRHEWLYSREWDLVVIDEVHYLKNPKAQRTVAVFGNRDSESLRAGFILALTGTPIPNRPVELRGLLSYLDPDNRDWYWKRYVTRYCAGYQGRYGWDVSGASNLDELQIKLRKGLLVRRLKKDVLKELPLKRRQVIELPSSVAPTAWQKEQDFLRDHVDVIEDLRKSIPAETDEGYAEAVDSLKEAQRVLFEQMSRVRHETAVAKAPAVADHVEEMLNDGGVDKVVVFAHHKDVINLLRERFRNAFGADSTVEVTGSTPMEQRQVNVDAFQSLKHVRIFVGNIQAAGVGLTLTAASNVVFAELDWVPGNISQAEDRCHRIGQDDSVLVQHIVLEESLDARIARTVVEKQSVIERALNAEVEEKPIEVPQPSQEARPPAFKDLAPEVIGAIQRALRRLAALDPDHAGIRNDVGFNGGDSHFGHNLAQQSTLSFRQAAAAKKILRKYHRQIDEEDYRIIYGESALEQPLSDKEEKAMADFLGGYE